MSLVCDSNVFQKAFVVCPTSEQGDHDKNQANNKNKTMTKINRSARERERTNLYFSPKNTGPGKQT